MTPSLTDLYVERVVRQLPAADRVDVERELRSLVAESCTAAGAADASVAEERALADLGDPDVLAAGYSRSRYEFLSPRARRPWRRIVVPVTVATALVAFFASALAGVATGASLGDAARSASGAATLWGVAAAALVTVVSFLRDRSPARSSVPAWTPDELRPVGRSRRRGLPATLVSVLVLVVLGVLLVAQASVPVLDPRSWAPAVPVLGAVVVLQIARTVFSYLAPRSARASVAIDVVLQVVALSVPVLMLVGGGVLDDGLLRREGVDPDGGLALLVDVTLVGLVAVATTAGVVASLLRLRPPRASRGRPAQA